MEKRFDEIPQGDARTYDDIVTDEDRDAARELLGFDATPEELSLEAERIADQRASFET